MCVDGGRFGGDCNGEPCSIEDSVEEPMEETVFFFGVSQLDNMESDEAPAESPAEAPDTWRQRLDLTCLLTWSVFIDMEPGFAREFEDVTGSAGKSPRYRTDRVDGEMVVVSI